MHVQLSRVNALSDSMIDAVLLCRGAANHSRVAEGTRPSPEGVYSGGS